MASSDASEPLRRLLRSPQGGFSLLELVVVIAIVSILFIVAVDRMLELRIQAERTSMEQFLGTLRSAMGIQVADRIAKRKTGELEALAGANPVDWLAETPKGYAGALEDPDPKEIQGYQWYFDESAGVLVYRVRNEAYFRSPVEGPARARFRVSLVYTDNNENGSYDKGVDKVNGLRLAALEPYEWLNEPVSEKDFAGEVTPK